jgi:N6-L-threonylcarbamoyladenine synthase
MNIVGIETSCDDTACSLINEKIEINSNVLSSQTTFHTKYGGIVPEIASRKHLELITLVLEEALKNADKKLKDLDLLAVTYGPGLVGSLLVGVDFVKTLSLILNKPFVGVNHLEGHLLSPLIENKPLSFPYLGIIISGGHTEFVIVVDFGKYEKIGETVDDACGEALDKFGKLIGLDYPAGPIIESMSINGDSNRFHFTIPKIKDKEFSVSYSGYKTAAMNIIKNMSEQELSTEKNNLASSFQEALFTQIAIIIEKILDKTKLDKIAFSGGVASNNRLRILINEKLVNRAEIYFPSKVLCTDNAAMIAFTGYMKYQRSGPDNLSLCVQSRLDI